MSDFLLVLFTIFVMFLNITLSGFEKSYEAHFETLKIEYNEMQDVLNVVSFEAMRLSEKDKKCKK